MTTEPSDYIIVHDADGDAWSFERTSLGAQVCLVGGYALVTVEDRTRTTQVGIWRDPAAATEARDIILSGAAEVRLVRCPEAP